MWSRKFFRNFPSPVNALNALDAAQLEYREMMSASAVAAVVANLPADAPDAGGFMDADKEEELML